MLHTELEGHIAKQSSLAQLQYFRRDDPKWRKIVTNIFMLLGSYNCDPVGTDDETNLVAKEKGAQKLCTMRGGF